MFRQTLAIACAFTMLAGCAGRGEQVSPAVPADRATFAQSTVITVSATLGFPASAATTAATGITHWGAFPVAPSNLYISGINNAGQELFRARALSNADGSMSILTTNFTLQIWPDGHFVKALRSGADAGPVAARMKADMPSSAPMVKPPQNRTPSSVRYARDQNGCEGAVFATTLAVVGVIVTEGTGAAVLGALGTLFGIRMIQTNCLNDFGSDFPVPPLGNEMHCYLDGIEVSCNDLRYTI